MARYNIRHVFVLTTLAAIVLAGGIFYWTQRPNRSHPTPEQVDAEIRQAIRSGKVVVVSVGADWSVETHVSEHKITSDQQFATLVALHTVKFLHADITDPGTHLPASLAAKVEDIRLPAVFVLGPHQQEPIIVQSKSVSPAQVLEAVRTALNGKDAKDSATP